MMTPQAIPAGRVGRLARRAAARPAHVPARRDHRGQRRSSHRLAELHQELDARGLTAFQPALLAVGRMVLARRRARASPSPSTSRIRGSRSSSARRCSKSKAARPSGACRSCATRPATRSTTPTSCASGGGGSRSSARRTRAYPEFYTPKPYSKSFVLHLDSWYAQSHPDEDFAETFAVWLNPQSDWRARYAGWPALKKLEYMDALMQRARGQADARAHAPQGRAAADDPQDAARALRAQAPALRPRCTRTSTIAICAGCSPIGPSTRAT